ncbi:MAG: prepilin-type N-terminal cleavage/methylation domain-containing protein [Candidatus Sumerlaeota bacterium]
MSSNNSRAFTLIELLVVVAIIAILAGIALPNFLEAQTRSKVARAKTDMRTISIGLETYHVDNNRYPESFLKPPFLRLVPLTSPVAYLSSVPVDVFNNAGEGIFRTSFAYGARPIEKESFWALASVGPDRHGDHNDISIYPGYSDSLWENPASGFDYIRYDPTNGTISRGDIWRVSDFNFQ